ncbi:B3/4 domain-containing protein [Sulfurisphaera javensis]|uniref:B3/4 domain-containing protein n=1 Tax=Sulfurisphaera javensis TaxID=2049879 RepID=A0AAT9GUE0_9CREN
MIVKVYEDAKKLGIFVGFTEVHNVKVEKENNEIEKELQKIEEKYRSENPDSLKDNPVVRAYRDFYWKIGIDPTKTRPSGEALRRRVARNGKLPRINNVVDAGNIVSTETLVPIGLYDMDKIIGNPKIILSKGNEFFYGIGKKEPEKINPNIPIMVDDSGKVMHIYPHRDSTLTNIMLETKNVLIVSAGVPGVEKDLVIRAAKLTAELLVKYANGKWDGVVNIA